MDSNSVKPPCWPELGVKHIWPKVKQDKEVNVYFPNYSDHEFPPRDYFWNVLARIKPEFYQNLIKHAIK